MSNLEEPTTIVQNLRPLRTDMDSFNCLVDMVADFLEGGCEQAEVEQQLAIVDQDLGHLRLSFEDGLRFQPTNANLDTEVALAYGAFKNLALHFSSLTQALQANRGYDVARAIEVCNACVNQLFSAFSNLREILAKDKYSNAPFINELVRVGQAFIQGQLSAELFQERFDYFCQFHDQFIEALQPLLAQVEGDPRKQQFLEVLEEQNLILDDIGAFFQEQDLPQLQLALTRLCKNSQLFLDLQTEFSKITENNTTIICLRCGQSNDVSQQNCSNCNTRLLHLPDDNHSNSELPSNLQKLVGAAQGYRDGKLGKADLIEVINWYESLTDQATQQMHDLAPPPHQAQSMELEQQEAYQEAVAIMQLGIESLKQGISRLRLYADHKDSLDLEEGIERALTGFEHMLHFAKINESLKVKS